MRVALTEAVCGKCALSIRSTGQAQVSRRVQDLLEENQEGAGAVVGLSVFSAPVTVELAKGWGEDLWEKMKKFE